MGSISDFTENEVLDHICNAAYTPPATVFLGLSTADPGDDAAGLAEPSGNGYIRKAITFAAAASRSVAQNADVQFDQATGAWGTLTHFGTFDAESGGNMLANGALNEPKVVISGNTPKISSGQTTISWNANEVSNYLANKSLDFVFRNQTFTQPDTYVGLVTASVSDSDTGSTITEPSGNGYARKQVNVNGGASPTWDLAAAGLVDNTHIITMGPPTGAWGSCIGVVIVDAAAAGNLLFYDLDMTDESPGNGDTVQWPVGDLDIVLT